MVEMQLRGEGSTSCCLIFIHIRSSWQHTESQKSPPPDGWPPFTQCRRRWPSDKPICGGGIHEEPVDSIPDNYSAIRTYMDVQSGSGRDATGTLPTSANWSELSRIVCGQSRTGIGGGRRGVRGCCHRGLRGQGCWIGSNLVSVSRKSVVPASARRWASISDAGPAASRRRTNNRYVPWSSILLPSKHVASTQCCFIVGPSSSALAQHWSSIGWFASVCWVGSSTSCIAGVIHINSDYMWWYHYTQAAPTTTPVIYHFAQKY